jgi:glycolate oxidase iron-sulfur subunit
MRALHAHGGEPAEAAALAAANSRAFRGDAPVISCATGCSAQLAEHADAAFRARTRDIVAHLAALDWPAAAATVSRPLRVALHVPCTQRFLSGSGAATATLLGRLPGLTLVPLAERGCCGAGGAQALGFGAQAEALGARTAAAVLATQPDVVVSANWGCALNLRAALAALDRPDLEVIHPVTLVARRFGVAAYNPGP